MNKINFTKDIENLQRLVIENTPAVLEDIQKAINTSKKALKEELNLFLSQNLPENIAKIKDEELRIEELNEMISEIIFKCKIPKAGELIDKMSNT